MNISVYLWSLGKIGKVLWTLYFMTVTSLGFMTVLRLLVHWLGFFPTLEERLGLSMLARFSFHSAIVCWTCCSWNPTESMWAQRECSWNLVQSYLLGTLFLPRETLWRPAVLEREMTARALTWPGASATPPFWRISSALSHEGFIISGRPLS